MSEKDIITLKDIYNIKGYYLISRIIIYLNV